MRLFVRRLIDNDVISPQADRHEPLAVLFGLLVSLGVFVTFLRCVEYLGAFVQPPGTAALSALSDRFLFIAGSMAVSALGALMVWNALALETRDAAVLGPLPIAARTIARAKLAAAVVFGTVLAVSLNAAPSVLYPALLTINIRGIRGSTLLQLIGAHAAAVTMAGLLGFFSILAARGIVRLVLGEQAFQRVSSGVQSALVVIAVAALLLAPTVRATDVRNWLGASGARRLPVDPVLWYLGVNETLGGRLVADIPVVLPPRLTAATFSAANDQRGRRAYRTLLPRLTGLARRGWLALPTAAALALLTFLWTNRRLPDRTIPLAVASRTRTGVSRTFERHLHWDPEIEAGFFFAWTTLTRRAPHRTVLAIAAAVGMTHALLVLSQSTRTASSIASTSPGVFAIAIGLLAAVLAGISHAVRVPAQPGANWTIRMAWQGDERRYVSGVTRAALMIAAIPVALLLPLHVILLGAPVAFAHSAFSLLFASAALDVMFLGCRKVPFACSYVPLENPKLAWPAGLAVLLSVTYGFAGLERWSLQSPARAVALAIVIAGAPRLFRSLDGRWRRARGPAVFEERPAPVAQRLGLFDHVMGVE
jgi:hypothetical protein